MAKWVSAGPVTGGGRYKFLNLEWWTDQKNHHLPLASMSKALDPGASPGCLLIRMHVLCCVVLQ